MERRLRMIYDSHEKLSASDAHSIIQSKNLYLVDGNKITIGMNELIDGIISLGFLEEKREDGTFFLEKNS